MHAKWSEEAKERVREARKAGRSVYEMFGSFYKNASKEAGRLGNSISRTAGHVGRDINRGINRGVNNAVNTVARNTIYKNRITKFNKDYNKINRIYKQYKGNMGKEERHAWTKAMHDERKKQLGNRSTKRVLNDFGKDIDKKTKKIRKNIGRVVDDAATAVGNATVYKKKRQSISNKVASLRKQQGKSKSMSEAMTRERQIKKVASKLNKRVSAGKVASDIGKAVNKNIDGAVKGARKSMKKAERDFGKGVDKAATAIGNHTISRYRDYQRDQDLDKMAGQFSKYMANEDMNSAKNQKEWKAAKKRVKDAEKRIKDAERRKKRVNPAKQVVSDALGELTGRYKNYGRSKSPYSYDE